MGTLFLLKQNHVDLAVAEAKAASYGWTWWEHKEQQIDGTLLLATRKRPSHLALSRFATKIVGECAPGNILTTIASLKLPVRGSFKVVVTNQTKHKADDRAIATAVWNRLKDPKVDLKHPDTVIDVVITSARAYIGIRIWTNEEDFESRRSHLLPSMHPSGMHPGIARALVNITCAKRIHDPFCGSGGILIEAGLAHKHASGSDIEPQMVVRARKNCQHFKLHPELRVADATIFAPRVQAVVADLPYGRGTRPVALAPLLEAFLHRQSARRAVIGLPQELPAPHGWRVRAHFAIYMHKSMTRHFYLLEKH